MKPSARPAQPRRRRFEARLFGLVVLAGLPGSLLALVLLWTGDYDTKTIWTVALFICCFWFGCAFALREKVRFPLQTLSNLLAGIREGDYSIRARGARSDDALGEVMREVNLLSENLREQRFGALEATALLSKVMSEIEVAVFTFDNSQRLRLVNRAGEKLLGQPPERLLSRSAAELGLADCLHGAATRTIQVAFPGGLGRWGMRRSSFREQGVPHQLLVLTDLSRTLREEERQAWQRLLRVLGHELNNSLAPIKSITGSMERLLTQASTPGEAGDWKEDMQQGLNIISNRVASLSRFMEAYTRIARLPEPRLRSLDIPEWIERVVRIETRMKVDLKPGPPMIVHADADQLEQLLINLIRNAVDAATENGGGVRVSWMKLPSQIEIWVEDDGPGLSNTANLFVPFFTTKPDGTGIGLVLSRQIAEAHGGGLTLENRTESTGCIARLRLPVG